MCVRTNQSVAAIVLNWNNYEDTSDCVESLAANSDGSIQIVVVDNGSTDNSLDRLRDNYSRPVYIQTGSNLGFAGGMNRGIQWARSEGFDFVLLLNNDIVLRNDTRITELVRKACEPDVGLVTPKVCESSSGETWFVKGVIDERWLRFNHQTSERTGQRYVENDYVPLCCSLLPLDVLKEVNDLSEEYFLYCEDAELGHRLRKNGYKLLTDTDLIVEHKVGGSSESSFSPTPAYYRTRNRHLFSERNKINSNTLAYVLYSVWWVVTRGVFAIYQDGTAAGTAVVQGEVDGWLGKTGQRLY